MKEWPRTPLDKAIDTLRSGRLIGARDQERAGEALANFRDAVRYALSDAFPDDAARVAWLTGWAGGAKMRGDL